MMTPVKMGKGRLSVQPMASNCSISCFKKDVTCNLIRIVVALDSMRKPPATDFVVATDAAEAATRAWGWTPPHEETEEDSKGISKRRTL